MKKPGGYMYILRCSDGSFYTGSTRILEGRIHQHKAGVGSDYTKTRLPVELVYYEEFEKITDAFFREHQIQGWSRKKKEALINYEYERLPELSKNNHGTSTSSVPGTNEQLDAEPVEASIIERTGNQGKQGR